MCTARPSASRVILGCWLLLTLAACGAVVEPGLGVTPKAAARIQEEKEPPQEKAAPKGLAQEEARRRRIQEERKRVLMEAYLADARKLISRGALDQAETLLLEALKTDPTHAEARKLLVEVQRRLGKRPAVVEGLAQRELMKRQVRLEAAHTEVLESLKKGDELMRAGNYAEAVRAYERAVNILTWNPLLGKREPDLQGRAQAALNAARKAYRQKQREVEEAARREAFARLREEEQREARRRAERVATILDKAQERFEANQFDEAERLVDGILEEEPSHLEARKLKEVIQEARHHYLDTRYLEDLRERFKRWRETVALTKVPEHRILRWPSQSFWDRISRERKVYTPTYGVEESPAVKQLKARLRTETIPLQFERANLKDVLDWIKSVANIPIVMDPEVVEQLATTELGFPLNLPKVKVGVALDTVMSAAPDFGYTFRHDVIFVTRKEKAAGKPIPVVHDVRDLIIPVQDFTPPQIRLRRPGAEEEGGSIFGQPAEEAPPPYNPEDLLQLIKENIATETWDTMEGVSIDLSNGRLIVIHTPEVQNQIARFLNNLRSFATSIVTIEARFITVRDNFLEEIGVDWRGLGGAGQKGTLAVLDDVTNGAEDMASAGLDNGGTGLPINNIQSPTSGVFFNDGEDGDIRARTENIFDRALGNLLSPVGGLTLSFAYLDDTQLQVILRAVEKSERATLLTAPRLTVYNTQRSNITLVNQISYIRDYDVEVAQTASIADPVIGILQDGLVLDVRPTITNDRRFVTLELRPTVADLVEPIRTITTTLGSQTQPVTIQLPELRIQSAETTITVPDRGTVLIGGLKNILSVDRRAEIPFLADIPLVGFLFSRKGRSEEAQDLILVVTVHISDLQEEEAQLRR